MTARHFFLSSRRFLSGGEPPAGSAVLRFNRAMTEPFRDMRRGRRDPSKDIAGEIFQYSSWGKLSHILDLSENTVILFFMFRLSANKKPVQALLLLVLLTFQSLLPNWHHLQHRAEATGLQAFEHQDSGLFAIAAKGHEEGEDCLVCQTLTRSNHSFLLKVGQLSRTILAPKTLYFPSNQRPSAVIQLNWPSPRGPPRLS